MQSFSQNSHKKPSLIAVFCLISLCMLACQEPTKEPSKPEQARKNPPKEEKARKKVTFEDIKDRFLHKNPKLVPSPKDTNLYSLVTASYGQIKTPHDLTHEEIDDLGLVNVYPTYKKFKRAKYFAYSLHNVDSIYILGIAHGGEFVSRIDYFSTSSSKKIVKHLFSLSSMGDGAFRQSIFAFFHTNQINVHDLFAHVDDVTYKQYRLTLTPTFELKVDTLQILKRKGYENDLFKEILQKYGLRYF